MWYTSKITGWIFLAFLLESSYLDSNQICIAAMLTVSRRQQAPQCTYSGGGCSCDTNFIYGDTCDVANAEACLSACSEERSTCADECLVNQEECSDRCVEIRSYQCVCNCYSTSLYCMYACNNGELSCECGCEPITESPTVSPTESPIEPPTASPTERPTKSPTMSPTKSPTMSPTDSPTMSPTESPTMSPTESPTISPTEPPTYFPAALPDPMPDAPNPVPSTADTLVPISSPIGDLRSRNISAALGYATTSGVVMAFLVKVVMESMVDSSIFW